MEKEQSCELPLRASVHDAWLTQRVNDFGIPSSLYR